LFVKLEGFWLKLFENIFSYLLGVGVKVDLFENLGGVLLAHFELII